MDAMKKYNPIFYVVTVVIFIAFCLGFMLGYKESDEAALPEILRLKKDGDVIAFARTNNRFAKIVNLPNLKDDPGVYVAFPLYSDEKNFARLLK